MTDKQCDKCGGTGLVPGGAFLCDACDGSGSVKGGK